MMILKYDKAIYDCRKVIENDKKCIKAYIRMAKCYFQLNKPKDAKNILEEGLDSCPVNQELQEYVNILQFIVLF